MKNNNEVHKAFLLGISRQLMWGYVAIAIFMIGSGLEQAFLSKQLIEMGFLANQAAFIFTIYGVAVVDKLAFLSAICVFKSSISLFFSFRETNVSLIWLSTAAMLLCFACCSFEISSREAA